MSWLLQKLLMSSAEVLQKTPLEMKSTSALEQQNCNFSRNLNTI